MHYSPQLELKLGNKLVSFHTRRREKYLGLQK